MRKKFYIPLLITLLIPVIAGAHTGSFLLPEGCGSCHVGHGLSGEPMLAESQEEFCYRCHGAADQRSQMVTEGLLSPGAELKDIKAEFEKPFRHPVNEGFGHEATEKLPAIDGATVNHAECVDCHNPHQRIQTGSRRADDVPGYSATGQYLDRAVHEYEICLKCHVNLIAGRGSRKDIFQQFSASVRSMHPVTRPISGSRPVSLVSSLTAGATMNCSDCHRSSDENGPAGPHGSNYRFLLSGNYNIDGRADESPLAYEFCYSCHDRASILGNESFPTHAEHIEGDALRSIPGTSCYTCHASHSSQRHAFLIQFNPEVVTRSSTNNLLEYRSMGDRSGQCYLTCHDHSHDPAEY